MAETEHRGSSAQNSQTLAKHDLRRESVAKKCSVLGCIYNPTNNKLWSAKARAATKLDHPWGIHKMRSLFYDMVYDGQIGSDSDPFCSSLEVGMLSDKVVRTSFFSFPCCRGQIGIFCH